MPAGQMTHGRECLLALLETAKPWPFRTTLNDVHDQYVKWFGGRYDLQVLDVTLAAAASERLAGDPCWLLIVSGSGAGKTETIQPLEGAGGIVVSAIASPGALLSGSARRERTDESTGGLLRRIGERGILIIKDVTSILTMSRDSRAGVLAALREIHDGKWVREVGTDGGRSLRWEGRLVLIGACTTAWDRAHEVIATMGDRFVLVRIDSKYGRQEAFMQAQQNSGHERTMRHDLSEAVGALLARVDPTHDVVLSDEDKLRLYGLANLVTLARTAVETNRLDDVVIPHASEMPTRFGKQLFQLIRGATALGMTLTDAMNLAARCARDSMPPERLKVLDYLATHPTSRVADITKELNLPRTTVKRTLDALQVLDLVLIEEAEKGDLYRIRATANTLIFSEKDVPQDGYDHTETEKQTVPTAVSKADAW